MSEDDLGRIGENALPWVVSVSVSGVSKGKRIPTRMGSGFVFNAGATSRILTTKQLVGLDAEFDADPANPALRKRDITIGVRSTLGAAALDPLHVAVTNPNLDIAQVVYASEKTEGLSLSGRKPDYNEAVAVFTWLKRNEVFGGHLLRVERPDDGAYILLNEPLGPSAAGAPVFDERGEVIAIVVGDVGPPPRKARALRVSAIAAWLPRGAVTLPPQVTSEVRIVEKRSGPKPSGPRKSFSPPHTICNDPLPIGAKIVGHEFFLIGDRACGAWSICRNTVNEANRVCYEFLMQGHDELGWDNAGVRNSEGVLRLRVDVAGAE